MALSSQKSCLYRQADDALRRVHVASETNGTDSLRMLKEMKADLVKKAGNPFCWSREGGPNPVPRWVEENGGYIITEDMLALAPFAKVFATDPENLLNNKH